MSKTHQSTQEEIDARRTEVAAAQCRGDGIHSTDTRDWHDWRLWKRVPRYVPVDAKPGYAESFGSWPKIGHDEQWYCTRCRKIEERTVLLEEEEEA